MTRQQEEREKKPDHDSWSGKMSPEHSQVTREKTSGVSLKKSAEPQMQNFLFLDLRKKSGVDKEPSWEMGTRWLGEHLMLNIGESPNEEKESTLSQILEANPHQKYYLSKTACEGILKRAERKDTATGAEDGSYKSDRVNDECLNNSIKAFHITQDPISMKISPCLTQGNSNTGQATIGVVIPVMDKASRYKSQKTTNGFGVGDKDDPAYTLTTADKHSVVYSIDRAAFNQGVNAKYNIGITEDIAQTIVAKGPSAVAHETYAMQGFGEYKSSDTDVSIKQRDFKDATDLVVAFEPGTVSRVGGHYYENGKSGTIRANPGDNQQAIIAEYIVRRLTPAECGRLQGFPDGWADNLSIINPTEDEIIYWKSVFKGHAEALGIARKDKTENQIKKWLSNPESDSAKYKMWGNGIALPCAEFVMQGISNELQRRNMKQIRINVPDGTQLLHLLAVIDKGKEIHYETKFCDLRDGNTEYSLNSNDEKK